jgi:hypothetical protein
MFLVIMLSLYQDGLLYCDDLLYVRDGFIQFQIFQARLGMMFWLHAILDSTRPWN